MKKLRVLLLVHPDLIPPESSKGYTEQEINVWKTEYDVVTTLRAAGHEVRPLGVHDELKPIRDEIDAWKPDVVFTLLEQFRGEAIYDQNVVSYLELMRVPYTGCNPRGLMLARGKDLSKTLVHYHRVPVPAFAVFPKGRKVKRPPRLALPLIVKSVNEDASYGISQASVVDSDEKLAERVNFIHERIGTAAIAEQYIEGREIYVGIVGNERLIVLPVWELQFQNMAEGDWLIATEKVKHDPDYQERRGIRHGPAKDLTPEQCGPHPGHGQADLSHAGARRLCAHRFSPRRRWHAVFSRSQSQSRNRRKPGICAIREAHRDRISGFAATHRDARHQTRLRDCRRGLSGGCDIFSDAFMLFAADARVPLGLAFAGTIMRGAARFAALGWPRRSAAWPPCGLAAVLPAGFSRLACSALACSALASSTLISSNFACSSCDLRGLGLFHAGESGQAAAGQVLHEGQRLVVDRHAAPGFDGEPGYAHDVAARLARQVAAMFEPFGHAPRPGIVGGGDEAEIAELQAKLAQKARRSRNRLQRVERIVEPAFGGGLRHELRDAHGAFPAYGVVAQPALLPDQIGKEWNRQVVILRRRVERIA